MKQRNLNKLFSQFHKNLQIPNEDKDALQAARRNTRSCLRQQFTGIKFMTQGSFAYHTLIRPNHTPPQRMDLDDGAYFTDINITSEELFEVVDSTLGNLADQKNWQLDTSKPTCSRLIISNDKHIDIPLYFVRGAQLSEDTDYTHRSGYYSLYKEANIPYYDFAESDFIWLAHRKEGWVKSDPRLIIDWVLKCTEKYGRQFLRVCCYFKAWRDNQWEKSPMKSLLIMAMVERAFVDEKISKGEIDDDVVALKVSGRMIDYLKNGGCVKDPSDDSQCLDKNLTPEEKDVIVERIRFLYKDMETALYGGNISVTEACELMFRQFGRWFPKDSGLIVPLVVAPTIISPPKQVKANRPWSK